MKTCTKCKIENPIMYFGKCSKNIDKLNNKCKDCQYIIRHTFYVKNTEKVKQKVQNYRDNNKHKIKELSKKYRENNREILKQKKLIDYEKNKEVRRLEKLESMRKTLPKVLARNKKRQLELTKRTPKWLTKEDFKCIELLYVYANKMRNKYDMEFHVDHIIPLNGKLVSGLHVPWNLRVIPQKDNLSKGNRSI